MTSAEHKIHFSTIEEQLESKNVVTFKWLSRKCKVHSTIAKQLLKEFVDASDKNKYSATYLVFGKDANGNLVINLSDNSDFNNAVDGSSVIDTQIYSIECSSSDITTDVLYNEEKLSFQLEQMDLSSISYPSKVRKNLNLRNRTSSVTNHKNNVETLDRPTKSDVKAELKKEKVNKLNFNALPKTKSEEKADNKSEQKTDAKSEDKSPKKLPVKTETESKGKNTKASKAATGKGSLSVLFQNHRVKNTSASSTSTSNEDKESKGKADNPERKEQNTSETGEEKQSEKSQTVKRSSPVKANKSQKTAKKSTAKSKKKPEKKKLKRVIAAFESSSDESDNDENSSDKESPFDKMEEEPEPEPEPEQPAEPQPATCVVQGKKRKRKVVSKNVMGEDGFFYTEKEVVYESCDSDDNNENDPNVNQESANKRLKTSETESNANAVFNTKTVSPPAEKISNKNQKAKTKQASIMNFFKKS